VAADAFNPAAVRRLLRAKGRGRDMPPPVLVAAATTLDALASKVSPLARTLVEELWPGR
jgi:tRNA A37 threonylcarbamoyladenosine synthetase subunit TsaC/SUA5/YrdC